MALWLCASVVGFSATISEVTVGVTNAPTNGMTLTYNGDVRQWATNVTNSALQIAITNTIGALRTNLYVHLLGRPFSGVTLQWGTNTNDIVLRGQTNVAMTVSVFGNWATISSVTNPVYGASPVTVPFTVESNSFRMWLMSELSMMFTNATSSIPAWAVAFQNFLGNTTNWQAFTNKFFYGGNWSGALTNTIAGGPGGTSQTAKVWFTNAWIVTDGTRTWGIQNAAGSKFYFSSVATNAEDVLRVGSLVLPWFDTNAGGFFWVSNNTDYVPARMDVRPSPTATLVTLTVTNLTVPDYVTVGSNMFLLTADGDWGYQFKGTTEGLNIYSPVQFGLLNTNQFAWQSNAVESVSIKAAARITNGNYYGTATNSGHVMEPSVSQSGLAAGPNIITVLNGDRQLLAATGGAASIIGITNSARGPANGDAVWLENGTGYPLTLVNESGSEPITVDRLRTVNQVSNVVVQPGGMALLKWNPVPGRWAVLYPEEISAVQVTNAVASYVAAVVQAGTNSVTTNVVPALPPIGAVIAWLKTLTNTLTLSSNWVECNGQILTNTESPLHLATIPNLNGANRFLRGNTTSGTTNGAATHTHGFTTQTTDQPSAVVQVAAGSDLYVGSETHVHGLTVAVTETGSSLPPSYDVVWVMRIR